MSLPGYVSERTQRVFWTTPELYASETEVRNCFKDRPVKASSYVLELTCIKTFAKVRKLSRPAVRVRAASVARKNCS